MTAKEMFEELGYKLYASNECFIEYEYAKSGVYEHISFSLLTKSLILDVLDNEVNSRILKAINKQIEELEW